MILLSAPVTQQSRTLLEDTPLSSIHYTDNQYLDFYRNIMMRSGEVIRLIASKITTCAGLFILIGTATLFQMQARNRAIGEESGPVSVPKSRLIKGAKVGAQQYVTGGKSFGDPMRGIEGLKRIYKLLTIFRSRHDGKYPSSLIEVMPDIGSHLQAYGFKNEAEVLATLLNPDNQYADSPDVRRAPTSNVTYIVTNIRPDETPIGGPKPIGTRDVLAYTNIYYHENSQIIDGRGVLNPVGFYLVLWDDGQVQRVPYDDLVYVPSAEMGFVYAYPGQAGVPSDAVTYDEFYTQVGRSKVSPRGKPIPSAQERAVPDNGGPEGLIALSKLLSNPIEREALWAIFNPSQTEFSLADVRGQAEKLKIVLQIKQVSLDDLAKLNTPSIFLTEDNKRLVVLSTLDAQYAIVLDQGMTRIVSREILAKRYGGEALLSQSNLEIPPSLLAQEPIRVLDLKAKGEEVKQQVKLTNNGKVPLKLQVERPIPGCPQADLAMDTLAPGASTTLNLTLKWRNALKGATQNIFVFVHTDDAAHPRLQLGFQLNSPKP